MEEKKEKKEKREFNKKAPILVILAAIVITAAILGGIFYRKAKDLVVGNIFSRLTGRVVDVEKNGEKVTVTLDEGEHSFEEGSLPDNFPSDIPIYPDAKLASSWVASGDGTDGLSLIWETDDSVSKVSNYYENELENAGWTLSFTSETEGSTTYAFEKNDMSGFIGITVEESKTVISLTLGL